VLVTEDGHSYDAQWLGQLREQVFSHNLLTLVTSVLEFPWLEQAIEDEQAVAYTTPKGIPTALQLKGKHNGHACTRWLIQASAWNTAHPNPDLLRRMRMLFEHCGVGTANTPASLGMLLQKRAFYDTYGEKWQLHRHPLPPRRCVEDLRERSTGARSDLLAETTLTFDVVYEQDQKNAYAAAFAEEQPTGPSIPHEGKHLEQYRTYVSHCTVEIPEHLSLGCFPVRQVDSQTVRVLYPTQAGQYDAFLWKEEIDLARKEGCHVQTGPGWGWLAMTRDNQRFTELMTRLRDTAPPEIVDWLKIAIVGSIGRHGSPWESTYLVPEEERREGDRPVGWNGLAYDWFVREACIKQPETMQHWFDYTLMLCRLALYQEALPYAKEGTLLATNVDAIYVSRETFRVRKEHSGGTPSGTWRQSTLSQVQFPALRHLVSREKIRRPGIPK